MTTWSVRCRVSSCRHRRVTHTHPNDYVRAPACPSCGARAGWRVEGRAYNKRGLCHCSGPLGRDGPIPHRTTHPMCDHHPSGALNQMRRTGVADPEIEAAWCAPDTPVIGDCPF